MAHRLPGIAATISLASLMLLAGCAPAVSATGAHPVDTASNASVADRSGVAAAPETVTAYLAAVQEGNLSGALALTDSQEYPAGADTAENVYRFLGTGIIRLQTWEFVGAKAADGGGEWVFVVCQVLFDDGWHSEVPLTLKIDALGRLVFVG